MTHIKISRIGVPVMGTPPVVVHGVSETGEIKPLKITADGSLSGVAIDPSSLQPIIDGLGNVANKLDHLKIDLHADQINLSVDELEENILHPTKPWGVLTLESGTDYVHTADEFGFEYIRGLAIRTPPDVTVKLNYTSNPDEPDSDLMAYPIEIPPETDVYINARIGKFYLRQDTGNSVDLPICFEYKEQISGPQ